MLTIADAATAGDRLPAIVAEAVRSGARAVVLRARDLPRDTRDRYAAALCRILEPVGGRLILAGPQDGGELHGPGDAVHLATRQPFPTPRPALVGRSCHTADEVARAAAEGCDYVTVSPVYPTLSKPGYGPPLGPAGLAGLAALAGRDRPGPLVYALGGVTPAAVPECLAAGAYGVAVMGPVLRTPRIVLDYLEGLAG
ncbi:thiamine phosphate synthase [Plantactinospora siamensis]|uniref:thiamine phosphate synthase n=1 Tax=Plantactinospora siamensis TaxID=555372 RepID=UPI0036711401